jgi:hypothetical protein
LAVVFFLPYQFHLARHPPMVARLSALEQFMNNKYFKALAACVAFAGFMGTAEVCRAAISYDFEFPSAGESFVLTVPQLITTSAEFDPSAASTCIYQGGSCSADTKVDFHIGGGPDLDLVAFNPGSGAVFAVGSISSLGFETAYYKDQFGVDATLNVTEVADNISAVPEPSTWAMMLLGFGGVGFMAYRRKYKAALLAA